MAPGRLGGQRLSPRATNIKAQGEAKGGTLGWAGNWTGSLKGSNRMCCLFVPLRDGRSSSGGYLGFHLAPPQALIFVAVSDRRCLDEGAVAETMRGSGSSDYFSLFRVSGRQPTYIRFPHFPTTNPTDHASDRSAYQYRQIGFRDYRVGEADQEADQKAGWPNRGAAGGSWR